MEFLEIFRVQGLKKEKEKKISYKLNENVHTSFLNWFIFLCHGPLWKCFQIVGIIFRYVITSYTISFWKNEDGITKFDFINICLDALFAMDLLSAISHRIIWYRSKKGSKKSLIVWLNKSRKPRKIWMTIVDGFSLVPFEIVRVAVEFHSKVHIIAHCIPMIRIYRILFYLVETSSTVSLKIHGITFLSLKWLLLGIIFTHSMTCVWFLTISNESKKAIKKVIAFDFNSAVDWYISIIYFIETVYTNIGFGDLIPHSDAERGATLCMAVVGFVMINGYFIGALSSVLMEKVRRLHNLRFRMSLIHLELANRKVPSATIKKVLRFYYSLWITRRGVASVNKMLDSLPRSLSSQVYLDIYSDALNASILFRSCNESFKRAISRVMAINLYMAGDVILSRSEINSQIFYIRKGTIQIMSYQDDETQIMTFGAGTVFGQCALLLSLPAKSQVHAATFCEIHTLTRRDLFFVLANYPDAKEKIRSVHRNLLLNMFADKLVQGTSENFTPGNVLTITSFYKDPPETSKLARDDICIDTTFPYTFMPGTIFLKSWNALHGLLILVVSFYYPYCAAFDRTYPKGKEAIILLVDMIYYFDIYLTFSTAVDKYNILVTALNEIVWERLKHINIYIDIVSSLPIHYFLKDNRIKPVFLCIRCLKLYKIPLLFSRVEDNINFPMISIFRLIKYILYFVFGSYAMGIAYYMQACYNDPCRVGSWYTRPPVSNYKGNPVYVSMYYAVMVISTTGYGDITVRSTQEILWVLFFFLIGVFLFCYLISEYSAYLSLAREPRQNFIELTDRINYFLVSKKMLTSERIRVRQYLNLQWEMNKAYIFSYDFDLFHDTPYHLLFEITKHMRKKGALSMELFQGLNESTLNAIVHSSFRKLLPPHEVVIYAGEVCTTLLIVEEGFCEMTFGTDSTIKKIVGPGENLVTVELFLGLKAAYHVRTLTHCIMLKVKKSDLRRALSLNPITAKELDETILEFQKLKGIQELKERRPILLRLQVRPPIQKSFYRFPYYRKQRGNKELRDPFTKLGICQSIRYLILNFTILPYGVCLKQWDLSRCVFAFLSAMVFPSLPYLQLQYKTLFYLGWVLDILAWIDLYFRFHICYYNERKLLISHPMYTSSHYLKGPFALDFIFCFPFDRIMHRSIPDANNEIFASVLSVDVLRMLRVGQIHRISPTLMNLRTDFLANTSIFIVITMLVGFTMIFLNLLTSFLFLKIINYKIKENGSYKIYFEPEAKDFVEGILESFGFSTEPLPVYTLLLYWTSVTSFGVGFGDITATTEELMIFIVIVILLSYLYFNYMTIVVASHLTSVNFNLTVYQKRLTQLIEYLNAEKIDPTLKQHTINYFEYLWKKTKGMQAESVFSNFNVSLKDDVMLHLYEDTLRKVQLFRNFDSSFFRILSNRLKELYYQSGAAVFKRGDVISMAHIIHQGEVTLVGRNEDETEILQRSRIFGHTEPTERGICTLSAVATKNVLVLCIPSMELHQLMEDFFTERYEAPEDVSNLLGQINTSQSVVGQENENQKPQDEVEEDTLVLTRNGFVRKSFSFSKKLNILYMITSFISVNLVSFHFGFQTKGLVVLILSIPVEIIYLMKVYLGFNTGFYDEAGEFVSDLQLIKKRYMSITGFYLDFFTIIPFEVIAFVAAPEDRFYVATLLRMTKTLRIYNIWTFFNQKFDKLNVNMLVLKIIAMSVWTFTLLHMCTCVWFMISCPRGDCSTSQTWALATKIGCKTRYLCSLYLVIIILTTTGFGDITPKTFNEILFVIFLIFIARFYMAIFIGQMVSTIQKSVYAKTKYEYETETLKDYLYANDVTPILRKSILNYVQDLWINERGHQVPELIVLAPKYLSSEIKIAAYGYHIHDNPIFQKCNPSLRKQLISALRRTVYFPGNIIVHEGEVNSTTYFIHSGQVKGKGKKKRYYFTGGYFGMTQCVRRRLPHNATYYAKSVCVILSLSLDDWEFLIDFYPQDIQHIYKVSSENQEDF